MRRTLHMILLATALSIASIVNALPHGDDEDMQMDGGMDMSDMGMPHSTQPVPQPTLYSPISTSDAPMSYFAYGKHSDTIIAHIALMVLAWCFVLPAGVMLSVARSRFALPTQFLFLLVNTFGMLLGIVYNNQTPDLYENNAHHRIGWVASSVACAQVVMSLIFTYAGRGDADVAASERAAFLPVSTDETPVHPHPYPTAALHEYSWSRDSGQGTERDSSGPSSPTCLSPSADYHDFEKPDDDHYSNSSNSWGWLRNSFPDRFLSSRIPGMISGRVLGILYVIYRVVDWLILPFGFVAISSGGVTYGGLMRGREIFNGVAHFIKGGIFFWYGVLTLGRWAGCYSDIGWAWNVKPPAEVVGTRKAKVPSPEFVESFVIWLYGASNMFLEHLSNWGEPWSARDLEHLSITFLFFGGGLCGMLCESKRVRDWINSTVFQSPSHLMAHGRDDSAWHVPNTQKVSLNPMPALVMILLGTMMGSHHQENMTSTMIHKQWGNLLSGFALARIVTYVLLFLKPPTSYLPSRPPSEVLSSFCLMGGGLIFMMSTRTIVDTMVYYELESMFAMTVGLGLTAFVMAWEILAIAIKAWAVRRETPPQLTPYRFPA